MISCLHVCSVLLDHQRQELLAFHWIPEAIGSNLITFPHLHIGPVLLGGQGVFRPGDLHKAHSPTGRLSLEAVIRLGISALEVRPLQLQ